MAKLYSYTLEHFFRDFTEEEIMDMVNEGHEQGVLKENEAEMIGNIFEFGEKHASDVMTHRKSIVGIEADTTVEEAFEFIMGENYSRYPVYSAVFNISLALAISSLVGGITSESVYGIPNSSHLNTPSV